MGCGCLFARKILHCSSIKQINKRLFVFVFVTFAKSKGPPGLRLPFCGKQWRFSSINQKHSEKKKRLHIAERRGNSHDAIVSSDRSSLCNSGLFARQLQARQQACLLQQLLDISNMKHHTISVTRINLHQLPNAPPLFTEKSFLAPPGSLYAQIFNYIPNRPTRWLPL